MKNLKPRNDLNRSFLKGFENVEIQIEEERLAIPVTRYEELIRAEAELDVVLRAYNHAQDYDLKKVLIAVFGPQPEQGESNA